MTAALPEVTDDTFSELVLEAEPAVAVAFSAPWCRPCKTIEPILRELADASGGRLRLLRLDIEANLRTPTTYGVLSLPTVIVFDQGTARRTLYGAHSKRWYARELADWLGP